MEGKKIYMADLAYMTSRNEEISYSAMSKPRKDTVHTLEGLGAELKIFRIYQLNRSRLVNAVLYRINVLLVYLRFYLWSLRVKGSIIFMQYPFSPIGHAYRIPMRALKRNGNRVIVLVHDLDTFRHNSKAFENLDRLFTSEPDSCIIHSSSMREELEENGWVGNYQVMEFFDYSSKLDVSPEVDLRNGRVIFAGNLEKSTFLRLLPEVVQNGRIRFYLYGNKSESLITNEYIQYKGRFSPEDFSPVEGDWGLVWDGDSLNGCGGNMGAYLRLNAPFKFSLYMAAKRPVIVWSKSAMAEYVRKYHIGICVDRIGDIAETIDRLSDEDVTDILVNVEKVSSMVRNGKKLESVFLKALCDSSIN